MTNEADIYNSVQTPQGKWFKLKDGEQARIRIISDAAHALIYQQEFTDKKTGEIQLTMRFAYLIWNHDAKKPQVWAGIAGATYDQIKRYITNPEYGDITRYDVVVEREGEQLQTKYLITASRKDYELDISQSRRCEEIDLRNEIQTSQGATQVMTLKEYHELSKNKPGEGEESEPLPPETGGETESGSGEPQEF
jgi:hypothetical protein